MRTSRGYSFRGKVEKKGVRERKKERKGDDERMWQKEWGNKREKQSGRVKKVRKSSF